MPSVMHHSAVEQFHRVVRDQVEEIWRHQLGQVEQAGAWLAEVLRHDHWLFTFGTGHSHLLALEPFYRAGGLARVKPILTEELMLHRSASASTLAERETGKAERLLDWHGVGRGDLLLVASNSGRNVVPVEMALGARARGARVIALTNLRHAAQHPSRHPSGWKLSDVADLVLDNAGVAGDAAVEVAGPAGRLLAGPTSTITGAFLLHLVILAGMEQGMASGWRPEVFESSNANGDAHNETLLARYRPQVPGL